MSYVRVHELYETSSSTIIKRVISGGQTGADQAGLRAAVSCGIPTGGTAPRHFLTETGNNPGLASYGLVEHSSPKYPPRTVVNIRDSDFTLIIAEELDGGSRLTAKICDQTNKPYMHLHILDDIAVNETLSFIREHYDRKGEPLVINVAGNRESKWPGIGKEAEAFLTKVFLLVK